MPTSDTPRSNPLFPVYIVSKGRHESRLTMRAFEALGVPYRVVIEEPEFPLYSAVIDPAKLLILDPEFQRVYDTFNKRGEGKGTGSGPARNFAWEHAISEGHSHHWVVDDNIKWFYRLNQNLKVPVSDGAIFRAMEDFVLRYRNVSMAGPNYFMFASRKAKMPPFVTNTRIYSCNLIRNDVPFRWRGRYNEDTDLSLRMLKAGWCTILFNAFLQEKTTTLVMKGGNTDTIYKGGTLDKSQMLVDMHPDVARVVQKWGRVHHHVDYRPFETLKLLRRSEVEVPEGVDDFGMRLKVVQGDRARPGPGRGKGKGRARTDAAPSRSADPSG